MSEFWMDPSFWWLWPMAAALFSCFSLVFWCVASFYEAAEKYKKDVPESFYAAFLMNKKANEERFKTSEKISPLTRIVRSIAIIIGGGFFLWWQLDLWISYAGGHVTLDRALVVQLTLFFPFLLFNYLGAHFFQRYLDNLPERGDKPFEEVKPISIYANWKTRSRRVKVVVVILLILALLIILIGLFSQ